jgi:hypothetical protein
VSNKGPDTTTRPTQLRTGYAQQKTNLVELLNKVKRN